MYGVMENELIADPLLAGTVQATFAEVFPAVATPIVGAFGTLAGVTELDAADVEPAPTPLVANTVNVYAVPFVRPVTV